MYFNIAILLKNTQNMFSVNILLICLESTFCDLLGTLINTILPLRSQKT